MRLLPVLPLLMLLAACSSTPAPTPEPDAYTWLTQESRAARFVQLIDRAGLADTLRNGRFLTMLAPTNDALTAAGFTEARIAAYPVDSARRFVLMHILATQRARTNFETGTPYATRLRDGATPATVEATTTSPGFTLNGGSSVVVTDRFARNATLHLLSTPLAPPLRAGTLWNALEADATSPNPRFARLRAALARADSLGRRLDTLLQNASRRLTLLAPTDAAFAAAGFATDASIQAASPVSLYILLNGHIGSDARFTNQFAGPIPGTVASAFPNAGAILISSPGTPSAGLLQPFNARATNGVFHTVNRVLLP